MTPAFVGLNDLEHRQKINTSTDDEPTRSF
jgi:hypothetical protein